MGIREETLCTIFCDVCGRQLTLPYAPPYTFASSRQAEAAAVRNGWTVDTFSTKCRNCVGVVTREEPWWSGADE